MMPVLTVDQISKCYRIPDPKTGHRRDFWALREVSFSLEPGVALGLQGANGSGKSTLLKIISEIVRPTSGTVRVQGTLAPLLDLGAGFHPELTGQENLYVYGSLIGLRRKQLRAHFDEIVAFAGIEDFLGTKVRHYSQGMQMRLAFSIASTLRPGLLLADEILAVGDVEFQQQALQRLLYLKEQGTAIVLVQHDPALIDRVCDRTLRLEAGVEMPASGK